MSLRLNFLPERTSGVPPVIFHIFQSVSKHFLNGYEVGPESDEEKLNLSSKNWKKLWKIEDGIAVKVGGKCKWPFSEEIPSLPPPPFPLLANQQPIEEMYLSERKKVGNESERKV